MKVFQFHQFGLNNLLPREVSMPVPGPHEVLVRVGALSLSHFGKIVLTLRSLNPTSNHDNPTSTR